MNPEYVLCGYCDGDGFPAPEASFLFAYFGLPAFQVSCTPCAGSGLLLKVPTVAEMEQAIEDLKMRVQVSYGFVVPPSRDPLLGAAF